MWSALTSPFVGRGLRELDGLERYVLVGDVVTLLLSSEDTDNELTLHEVVSVYREGVAMRMHVHPMQTQYFRVMHGIMGYQIGDQRGTANPGDIVVMPAGVPHRTWTAQPGELHALVLTTPGGLDETIRRFGTRAERSTRPVMDITEWEIDELCEQMLTHDTSVVPQMCE